jgi:hypothetical protein
VGGLARFLNAPVTEPVPRWRAGLKPGHDALTEGRTIFPSSVFDAADRPRVLISGINNAKLGNDIRRGDWKGMPVFHFALEERATCPRTCAVWAECYGNNLPVAVRFKFNENFLALLEEDLALAGDKYPDGFAVRAHTLGDFVDLNYVGYWQMWLHLIPEMRVWGYTAHQRGTEIGDRVIQMNDEFPNRWVFRTSVHPEAPLGPWQATTTWTKPEHVSAKGYRGAGGTVCPAEVGGAECCATCGLCFHPKSANTRITFLGHGGHRGRKSNETKLREQAVTKVVTVPVDMDSEVTRFMRTRGVTVLPAARARGI